MSMPDPSPAKARFDYAPVVVLTTSKTTTSGVLAVLSYTSMTGRDVTTVLSSV